VRSVQVDLYDRDATAEVVGSIGRDVTHVVYAALFERPGLADGWEAIALNQTMLENLFDPLLRAATKLEHVSLLHGTKAYGVHHPDLEVRPDADAGGNGQRRARGCAALGGRDPRGGRQDVQHDQRSCPQLAGDLAREGRGVRHAAGVHRPMSLLEELPKRDEEWRELVGRHGVEVTQPSGSFAGHDSLLYADWILGDLGVLEGVLNSTIAVRQSGFNGCIDSEAMFRKLARAAQASGIAPGPATERRGIARLRRARPRPRRH